MGKKRLGRGLDSLISHGAADAPEAPLPPGDGPREVEISRVELSRVQPRQSIDADALRGLADSIRRAGVLQPVVVRPRGEMYELVMGERRLRAAHMAGLERVPALVRDVPDDRMLEFALIENVQREDLNPMDKAVAVQRMIRELALTQEDAGRRLGLERSTVANLLRLLDLPPAVQDMVSRGTLSAGHARAILALPGEAERVALAERVVREGLSVRQAERLAAAGAPGRPPRAPAAGTPQIRHLESALRERLGARVQIRSDGARGRLVIHFSDLDEFERLYELLMGGAP
jgi:ParB family chromosome partitioning protein